MKTWSSRSSSRQSPDVCQCGDAGGAASVDAHVHVFPPVLQRDRQQYLVRDERFKALYSAPSARMVGAEQAVEHMDEVGIGLAIVFGFAFRDLGLCREANDYVIESVRSRPDRLAGLAVVPLGVSGAESELERCLDGGLRGCGELAPTSGPADLEALRGIADVLRERGAPLLIHASEPVGHGYPGKGEFTPEDCLVLAKEYPGLKIVLAHLGGGLFVYELMPEVREALATVYYDTAATPYLYDPKVYETVALTAGAEKLVFGSDYPLLSPDRCLRGLERLSAEDQALVRGENARRVYGL